jgi:hypothetical protein
LTYPELYNDERVVLQAQNVKVKSVVFEIVLTTRRLVLIDTKKNSIPPQEINLATLKDVESGENAIRDPTITISIITISGNTRQMVLTFSKTSGGERRRECDDWVRALRQNVTSTIYHPVTQAAAPRDTEPAPAAKPSAAPVTHRIEAAESQPPKKRIEIARPMKKIVEPAPVMPVPIETSSLPTGSFCNRCGNRVPPESVFCNRCGTPVSPDAGPVSQPEEAAVPVQQPVPLVPQVQITQPAAVAENKDSRIEEVIHTIEPLIEDSVPRTAPAPLIPAKQVHYTPAGETAEPAGQAQPAGTSEFFDAAPKPSEVQWPVLSNSGMPDAGAAPDVPPAPATPPAVESLPPSAPKRRISFTLIAILAIVVLAVIAGAYIFMQGQAGTPGITPTPTITPPVTTIPHTKVTTIATTVIPITTQQPETTPFIPIPASGVWVKVSYPNTYKGTLGTPGSVREVVDTGEHFYQISTSNGPVVVSIQKDDGTSSMLSIDVYKDGDLMKHGDTVAPRGIVEFLATLKVATTTTTPAK